MKFVVALFLISLPLVISQSQLCYGTQSSSYDDWCNVNCNSVPSFCPESFCSCINGPTPSASPSPYYGSNNCYSIVNYLPDQWCNDMCHHNPPYCPSGYCNCQGTPEPTPVVLVDHTPGCCNQDKTLYYVSNYNIYRVNLDANTRLPVSTPELCAQFLSPLDMALADDGSLYVVDTVASRVYRVAPNCGEKKVILDWTVDGHIAHPRAVTIIKGVGRLSISDNSLVYIVTLDTDFNVISVYGTPLSLEGVIALDTDENSRGYLIEPGFIKVYDPAANNGDGDVYVWADLQAKGWPDISGIKVTSNCGLFITVTDSNQVWRCPNLDDSSTCHVACDANSAVNGAYTCTSFQDPYGVTVDCSCNVYVAQQGNGNIVFVNETSLQSTVILNGLYHPYSVQLYEGSTCGTTSSNTPSRSASPSATMSPTPSPSPAYETAIRIDDYNTACASGNCGINTTTALLDSNNSRKFGVLYFLNFDISLIGFQFSQCFSAAADSNGNFICTKLIDPTLFISPDFSTIQLYIASSAGMAPPAYAIAPAIFDANVFPNASKDRVVSAQIPCTGYNGVTLRVVLNHPLPCWNDTVFNKQICQVDRATAEPTASTFVNSAGQQQGEYVPFKEVICVVAI